MPRVPGVEDDPEATFFNLQGAAESIIAALSDYWTTPALAGLIGAIENNPVAPHSPGYLILVISVRPRRFSRDKPSGARLWRNAKFVAMTTTRVLI
jgi:hypothetical protein